MQTLQVRLTKELVKKAQDLVDKGLYSNKSEVIRDSLRRLVFDLSTTLNRNFTVLFTSDLHGNLAQYQKLFKKAEEEKANAIIMGGDVAPKDEVRRTIKAQKDFLEKELLPLIKKFRQENDASVFIILGNDDFKTNEKVLRKYEKESGYKLINGKSLRFHEDFKIMGYSYVPLTPFKYKDWEKLDLNEEDETIKRKKFTKYGIKIKNGKFIKASFNLNCRKKTIEKDLNNVFKEINPGKTILVSHSPPYNTNLDILKSKEHVGSAAVRKFIEEKQPYLTLHGHIHETVDVSKKFMQKIGETISITSGNDPLANTCSVIKFNLYEPEKAERIFI